MNRIVTDINQLRQLCHPVTLEEGVLIGKQLLEVLGDHEDGIGLAANQIGIHKRVCVINVRKPIVLINPEIVGCFDRIQFNESCLSFAHETIITQRYRNILVKADNYHGTMAFHGKGEMGLLEAVCVQHEIDHLNGLTMHDRRPTS